APFDVVRSDFVMNAYYTNDARRASVSCAVALASTRTAAAEVSLYIDDDGDGRWDTTGLKARQGAAVAGHGVDEVAGPRPAPARFMFTNTGAAGSAAEIVRRSSRWVKE